MESEGGNSKPQTVHTEPSHDGDPIVDGKMSCSSSSSSSSSALSFDPLTDSDDGGKENILGNSTVPTGPSSSTAEFVKLPETSENPSQTPEWSMISASPRAGPENSSLNPEWRMINTSLKQSPPIQTMWRPVSGYDPHRIPSSIFMSKPNAGMEWSVASNESLFSIQMGNTSFSGNNVILSGKSQELGRPDEFSNCIVTPTQSPVCQPKSNELNISPPTPSLPTVIEAASDDRANSASSGEEKNGLKEVVVEKPRVVMKEKAEQAAAVDAKPKVVVKETEEEHGKEITPPRFSTNTSSMSDGKEFPLADGSRLSASTPRLSDESGTSASSFAFPVLTGEERRSASVRVAPENLQLPKPPEKPKLQPQEAPPTKAAETRSWFSCFSCRLPCC
ncbi:Ataxin-7 like [Actinidia chinensis var. chinensis]|uniref:Ataxin-7 like n=1 Tax=Actinidia chinensis var. chinensis TaxID=1590841 RepID=A0A2R6RKI0_ACTCC|nr:Ataxin-7 like [Actinidia chinensis var. chinensis]